MIDREMFDVKTKDVVNARMNASRGLEIDPHHFLSFSDFVRLRALENFPIAQCRATTCFSLLGVLVPYWVPTARAGAHGLTMTFQIITVNDIT